MKEESYALRYSEYDMLTGLLYSIRHTSLALDVSQWLTLMTFNNNLIPQAQEEASTRLSVAACAPIWQIRDVGVPCQQLCNVLLGLDSSDHDQAIAALCDGLADGVGSLGLTLCADDIRLPLLFCLLNNETCAFRLLLCNLLLLDSPGELLSEGHVRNGDILEGNVELAGALEEVVADAVGDGFSLCDELGSVKLGNDGLQDFVSNGRKHALIVVETKVLGIISHCASTSPQQSNYAAALRCQGRDGGAHLVNLGQHLHFGTVQHSQRKSNHLQILATGGRGNVPRSRPHIIDDGLLQPRNQEVCALVDDLLLHTGHPVEDDGARSTFHIVQGSLREADGDGAGDGPAENGLRNSSHGDVCGSGGGRRW